MFISPCQLCGRKASRLRNAAAGYSPLVMADRYQVFVMASYCSKAEMLLSLLFARRPGVKFKTIPIGFFVSARAA